MRGTVAKRIRKAVYGDMSSNPKARNYMQNEQTGKIVSTGLRSEYQEVKKEYRG